MRLTFHKKQQIHAAAFTIRLKNSLIFGLTLLVAACGGGGDDLDHFIETAGNNMHSRVTPLPEVKPYIPLIFNADGILTDPFKPRKPAASKSSSSVQPDINRPREPLEAYSLESLKYVGSISRGKLQYALVKTPDNNIQQVKIGNFLGQNLGMITDITDNAVIIKEIVQDDLSGDWVERTASMNLQE